MARLGHSSFRSLRSVAAGVAALVAALVGAVPAHASLTGKWVLPFAVPYPLQFVDISESGGTISFTFGGLPFTGTRLPSGRFEISSPGPGSPPCPLLLFGSISADENLLGGGEVVGPPCGSIPSQPIPFLAQRCQCFDDNDVNGDGCDDHCQVEPCYTCTGDPSTCMPTPDGGACDDGHVCTTGETCTAGVCGGGSVVTSCVDLTGNWRLQQTNFLGTSSERLAIVQTGSFVRIDDADLPGSLILTGTIDPATGALTAYGSTAGGSFVCFGADAPDALAVDATAAAFSGLFDQAVFPSCSLIESTVSGSRCGGGTLDPGEECDDGNATAGDGCDASCHIEPCYTCITSCPSCVSQCTALMGSPCDDGNPCTVDDVCSAGSCTGTPVVCDPCFACGPGGVCIAAPRLDCRAASDPAQSLLRIRDSAVNDRDTLLWKWKPGTATPGDFGDPLHTDDYTLCLYDQSGSEPVLLFRAAEPAGSLCAGAPCWSVRGSKGFRYRDDDAQTDGVLSLSLLAPSTAGKAKITFKGKGANLSGRPFGLPSLPLPLPMTMQLQNANGACFTSVYTTAAVNDAHRGLFKARGAGTP